MKVYIKDDLAFVDTGNGYMLCIGRKEEAQQADDQKLVSMIREAVVLARWFSINTSKGQTIH